MGKLGIDIFILFVGFQGFILKIDDIVVEVESYWQQGIEVGKIDQILWGKFVWFKDLDGNSFCLYEVQCIFYQLVYFVLGCLLVKIGFWILVDVVKCLLVKFFYF